MVNRFSVLMAVTNGDNCKHFSKAISSIWHQQTIRPDQIVLIQDGPLDDQLQAEIDTWTTNLNGTLQPITSPVQKGLAHALNIGLSECKNEIIFRMDADDISISNRFEKQLEWLDMHPKIDVLGAYIEEFEEINHKNLIIRKVPTSHKEIINFSQSRNPISHPVVAFKKSSVLAVGGYPEHYPEDYFLWIKMLQAGFTFENLPIVLLSMRTDKYFLDRRGIKMLLGEIQIYFFMYKSRFIPLHKLIMNILLRSAVRLSPRALKAFFYRHAR